jgi:rhodanese-related sulfurtransferase
MSATHPISPDQLFRLLGTPDCPDLIDVRIDEDFAAAPSLIPRSHRRSHRDVADWTPGFSDRSVAVICKKGQKLSEGVAAWLRHAGVNARVLEGGHEAWTAAGLPTVPAASIPPRDAQGRTLWVTRARPKIDRIACPWLIRRFVDPSAVFLFVTASEVRAVAERFNATPFDVDAVAFSHRGERCTFDTMIDVFGLETAPLQRLATIVRAADTGRLGLSPQAPGLLAASLGLSAMHDDDLKQLAAGLALYDAFYRWCRDGAHETHDGPATAAAT